MRSILALGVSVVLLAAGCFRSSSPSAEVESEAGPPRDTSTDADVIPSDGGTMDSAAAPLPDAQDAGGCIPGFVNAGRASIDLACGAVVNTSFTATPFSLQLYNDQCRCGVTTCAVTVDTEARTVHLATQVCEDPTVDCDCFGSTHVADCDVPSLPVGSWTIAIEEQPAFEIQVVDPPAEPIEPDGIRCFRPAPEPGDAFVCEWPPMEVQSAIQTCVPAEIRTNQVTALDVSLPCADCFDASGWCEIAVQGNTIDIEPRIRSCVCPVCGPCAEGCSLLPIECQLPPLSAGEYELRVRGQWAHSLQVVDEPSISSDPTCVTSESE